MEPAYVIEFVGGCRDGEVFDSRMKGTKEAFLAGGWASMTHQGQVGRRVKGVSPAVERRMTNSEDVDAPQRHDYEVAQRTVEGDVIYLRLQYCGAQ